MTIKSRLLITSFSILAIPLVMGAAAVSIRKDIVEKPPGETDSGLRFFIRESERIDKMARRLVEGKEIDFEKRFARLRRKFSNSGIVLVLRYSKTMFLWLNRPFRCPLICRPLYFP
jgi:hypothetical protein